MRGSASVWLCPHRDRKDGAIAAASLRRSGAMGRAAVRRPKLCAKPASMPRTPGGGGWPVRSGNRSIRISDLCDQHWDRLWHPQIKSALDFRVAVLPARELSDDRLARLFGENDFPSAWPEAQRIRDLAAAIPSGHRPSYDQDSAGRWQAQMELSARLMAATRAARHVPETSGPSSGASPGKCTLFGSWEQMGPCKFRESQEFWRKAAGQVSVNGVRLRRGDRLCAVALTKRFAGPALLAPELELTVDDLRFPDTATVAAADWLARAGIAPDQERRRHRNWSGLWLHWRERHQVQNEPEVPEDLWRRIRDARRQLGGPPSSYYAVIALDGDEMGRWLAGQKTPPLHDLLHPKLRRYFAQLEDPRAEGGLAARRPVGPALHGAISAALAAFATEVAPRIVAKHHGTMIYSGGDDVLALCPVATALDCTYDLRQAFSGLDDPAGDGWRDCGGRRRITMGDGASLSGGLAVIHYHEDLRLALETARVGETGRSKRGATCSTWLQRVVPARSRTRSVPGPAPAGWMDCAGNSLPAPRIAGRTGSGQNCRCSLRTCCRGQPSRQKYGGSSTTATTAAAVSTAQRWLAPSRTTASCGRALLTPDC